MPLEFYSGWHSRQYYLRPPLENIISLERLLISPENNLRSSSVFALISLRRVSRPREKRPNFAMFGVERARIYKLNRVSLWLRARGRRRRMKFINKPRVKNRRAYFD